MQVFGHHRSQRGDKCSDGMKRPFTIAIMISLAWHFFLGATFNVVVTPIVLSPVSKFSHVNFLGPLLLEDISPKTGIEARPTFVRGRVERTVSYKESFFYAKIQRPKKEAPEKRLENLTVFKERAIAQATPSLYEKALAPFFYEEQQEYEPKISDLMGPIIGRKVFSKPEVPTSVKWPVKMMQDQDIDSFDMMLRFYVSPGGEVESVEKIYSSGYPEVDIIGIRYIKMWKFAPASGDEPQMGMIRINFRQK